MNFKKDSIRIATKVCLIATSFVFPLLSLIGQDVHFSNFTQYPPIINPAQAGFFSGHYRIMGQYRMQWRSVPVNYQTIAGGVDASLRPFFSDKDGRIGLGIFLFNDEAGDADLSNNMVAVQGAFHEVLYDKVTLSAGVYASLHQRKANPNAVTWESQYNGDQYDPALPSGESFTSQYSNYYTAGVGISISYQNSSTRSHYRFGISSYNLNKPRFSFASDTEVKLGQRYNFFIQLTQQVQSTLDVNLNGLLSQQGSYREILVEVLVRKYFPFLSGNNIQIFGGLGVRIQDAFYPKVGIRINQTEAGVSYDINVSEWKQASLRRGGPELFIHHIIYKVEPPKEFKTCPVF